MLSPVTSLLTRPLVKFSTAIFELSTSATFAVTYSFSSTLLCDRWWRA